MNCNSKFSISNIIYNRLLVAERLALLRSGLPIEEFDILVKKYENDTLYDYLIKIRCIGFIRARHIVSVVEGVIIDWGL